LRAPQTTSRQNPHLNTENYTFSPDKLFNGRLADLVAPIRLFNKAAYSIKAKANPCISAGFHQLYRRRCIGPTGSIDLTETPRRMPALGQKAALRDVRVTSALPSITDIRRYRWHVRFVLSRTPGRKCRPFNISV
jgi:hypothetical protein